MLTPPEMPATPISPRNHVPMALGGTLRVALLRPFNPNDGDTFDLFDWGSLSGVFESLELPTLAGCLRWDTSELYTAGVLPVSGPAFSADFDSNRDVDEFDLNQWEGDFGSNGESDSDGDSDGADFLAWQQQVGIGPLVPATAAVPEPGTVLLIIVTAAGNRCLGGRKRQVLIND